MHSYEDCAYSKKSEVLYSAGSDSFLLGHPKDSSQEHDEILFYCLNECSAKNIEKTEHYPVQSSLID